MELPLGAPEHVELVIEQVLEGAVQISGEDKRGDLLALLVLLKFHF